MNKSVHILIFLIILATLSPLAHPREAQTNVIVISVDTLRADRLGCYGYPRNTSPNLDGLAEDGTVYSHCYTLIPLTGPSFSTMLTSLPEYKHGAKRNGLSIYNHVETLPMLLKKKNYYNGGIISNWPLRQKLSDLHRGFDDYLEIFTKKRWLGIMQPEGKAPDVTAAAIQWLEKNRTKPFFLWVHYSEPHAPYLKHKGFDFGKKRAPEKFYPPGMQKRKSDHYDSEVGFTDHHIGVLIDKLKEWNLYRDSLIMFNSDHGESLGEHNYVGHGRRVYNSMMHVPLIVKRPGNHRENKIDKRNCTLMDVAPTILASLDMDIPQYMEGKNLLDNSESLYPLVFMETYKGAVKGQRSVKFQLKVKPLSYAVVKGNAKLIYTPKSRKFEAYNLQRDPFENINLYYKSKNNFVELQDTLKQHMATVKKYIQEGLKKYKQKSQLSKEDQENLKTLGYL